MSVARSIFGGKQPPSPPPPPPSNVYCRLSVWYDGNLTTLPVATLECDQFPGRFFTATTEAPGRYLFTLPPDTYYGWGGNLMLTGTNDTAPYEGRCLIKSDIADVEVQPKAPPRRSQQSLTDIKANFCNLRDSQNRVVFTAFLMGLSDDERAEWYRILRDAGSTHIVFSPNAGYPNSPIPAFDYYADPQRIAGIAREILQQTAQDGYAMTPILFLDNGEDGFPNRMNTYWQPIRDAIGDDQVDMIICPGWELITASTVTSKQYSDALLLLNNQGWSHIWSHLSPNRAACSSNPLQPDDPWQGGESDCWKSYGGQYVEGLFFQAEATRPNDDMVPDHTGWLDRWDDVVPRLCNGLNGWRGMKLCFFESPAYYYYRGESDSDFCRRIADRAKQAAQGYGATVSFGNGLPY